jgi:hypothetical protein
VNVVLVCFKMEHTAVVELAGVERGDELSADKTRSST